MSSRVAPVMARLFTSTVRNRGEGYNARGAVRIVSGTSSEVRAVVTGAEEYNVEIGWKGGEVSLFCSCPGFEADGPCKHLWATVLAAEADGYLADVTSIRALSVPALKPESEEVPDNRIPLPDEELPGLTWPAEIWQQAQDAANWKKRIEGLVQKAGGSGRHAVVPEEWPEKRQLLYVVEIAASLAADQPVISLCTRERKSNGGFGKLSPAELEIPDIARMPAAEDREILSALAGAAAYNSFPGYRNEDYGTIPSSIVIRHPLSATAIPMIVRTGRCYIRRSQGREDLEHLTMDEGDPWTFGLEMRLSDKPQPSVRHGWMVAGMLRRGDDRMEITAPSLVTRNFVFANGKVGTLADSAPGDWIRQFRSMGSLQARGEDRDALLGMLLCTPGVPNVEVPAHLRFRRRVVTPVPCLTVKAIDSQKNAARVPAELSFDYAGKIVRASENTRGIYDADAQILTERDLAAEQSAARLLEELGVRFRAATWYQPDAGWEVAPGKLQQVTRALLDAGWQLDVDGQAFRRPGAFRMAVSTGIDWFELQGEVEFGSATARLPELLAALRRGESTVRLSDGSYGVIPEELLARVGMLAGMGTEHEGAIRFRRGQAGLLDALLASQPDSTFDAGFARVREELNSFRHIEAAEQPAGFVGHLRDYQREGLGWIDFLRRFSFGGCLADDMGVGKTAQVLALLENRRVLRQQAKETSAAPGPSLVVVPKSLLFNWRQEAERFTPQLRVLDYTGLNRSASGLASYDLILTTYGTLRRDAAQLKNVRFDYVILDEAQTVKNSGTESAKAVRLLKGEHRLALSGTPVENHLGELWSLFEFLNPGMLGAASVFRHATGAGRVVDEETRQLLSQALRPFILRRTKDQVARELPAKTEQTIYCELEAPQRKLYDELRQHYRDSLLRRVDTQGLGKSKIMVLEALLRLRQAACHPGLLDASRVAEPSAKLDALLEQIREVLESGHKALVFSQFTSLLAIVRTRLESEKIVYEYLDGKTRDRQTCVERFQNDPDCPLFLISLKAGGLGLNLTAAEYVFLLDPWWNPAVEAQAVDRAHRIGQTRPVFAYRLIARDTVEEKVLELQKTKRDLAAAIIGEDNALIRNLRREDLELLLS